MPERPSDAELMAYITTLKRALYLRHWTVRLSDEEPERDEFLHMAPIASMFVGRQGNFGELKLHPALWERDDPADVRQTITHELLHLHTDPPFSDLLTALEAAMAPAQYETVRRVFTDRYERMTDALADAMEQFLPLPPWSVKAAKKKRSAKGDRAAADRSDAGS